MSAGVARRPQRRPAIPDRSTARRRACWAESARAPERRQNRVRCRRATSHRQSPDRSSARGVSPPAGGRRRPRSAPAPVRSCRGRYVRPWRGSWLQVGQRRKLGDELRLVLETAQVEKDAARLDAPDDRDRQPPQGAGQCLDRGAGPADRSQRQGGARQQRHRQCAAADLAFCLDQADLGDAVEGVLDRGQQAFPERSRSRSSGRASRRSAGRRSASRSGSA